MLARTGVAVEVIEREPALRPAGTGMHLPGNAARALRALGSEAQVAARAGGLELPYSARGDPEGVPVVLLHAWLDSLVGHLPVIEAPERVATDLTALCDALAPREARLRDGFDRDSVARLQWNRDRRALQARTLLLRALRKRRPHHARCLHVVEEQQRVDTPPIVVLHAGGRSRWRRAGSI